jgi:hypothetical protein
VLNQMTLESAFKGTFGLMGPQGDLFVPRVSVSHRKDGRNLERARDWQDFAKMEPLHRRATQRHCRTL